MQSERHIYLVVPRAFCDVIERVSSSFFQVKSHSLFADEKVWNDGKDEKEHFSKIHNSFSRSKRRGLHFVAFS